jgi:hypothetical protein
MIDFKYVFGWLYELCDWLGISLDLTFTFLFEPPWWPS